MSKIFKVGLVGLLVLSVLAVFVVGGVLADDAAPAFTPNAERFHGGGRGPGFGRGLCGEAGQTALAEALGMTTDELSAQLWGGKTLANLADEAGVDLQTVQDAVNAACQTAMREAIEQAVEDGNMSREKADWLLEGLDKGYWGGESGPGPGFGGKDGFGGFHAPGRFGSGGDPAGGL